MKHPVILYSKAVAEGLVEWLGKSEIVWSLGSLAFSRYAPHLGMGYEKKGKFLLFKNTPWWDLPTLTQPREAEIKIELHEAYRAGDHLDVRIKLDSRVYDFAIVKRTNFPAPKEVYKVVRRHNHSLTYFERKSHYFPEGTYGYGNMKEVYRGKIDVFFCDKTKIEFEIADGPYQGRYCVFTEKSSVIPETILRMKDSVPEWKERRPYSDNPAKLEEAYKSPNYISEQKIDGANYRLVFGDKVNHLISRRLSSNGQPIDKADRLPNVRYWKNHTLKGKTLNVEVVEYKGDVISTSALLNSGRYRSRNLQVHNRPLIMYVWDIEMDGPYSERRKFYTKIANSSPRIDMRAWGSMKDRFLFKRLTNPRILQVPLSSDDIRMSPEKTSKFFKDNGLEGAVVKNKTALYNDPEPWLKDKKVESLEVTITGFQEGTGKYKDNLGALLCQDESGTNLSVGTGISDSLRYEIWHNQSDYLNSTIRINIHERNSKGNYRGARLNSL